jgi:hypothetical protein
VCRPAVNRDRSSQSATLRQLLVRHHQRPVGEQAATWVDRAGARKRRYTARKPTPRLFPTNAAPDRARRSGALALPRSRGTASCSRGSRLSTRRAWCYFQLAVDGLGPHGIRPCGMAYAGTRSREARHQPGLETANGPQNAEKPHQKANSNRSPRLVREPRTAANTGEYPRKRWASGQRVRLCSRLFVGLETANGPQRARKWTAKGPQALPPKRPSAAVR